MQNLSSSEDSGSDDDDVVTWKDADPNSSFVPRLQMSSARQPRLRLHLDSSASEVDVFRKFFPRSLLLRIVECTNERIRILNEVRKSKAAKNPTKRQRLSPIEETDEGEIIVVLGVILVMSYCKLPEFHDYWSSRTSLGNQLVKEVISRDRFCILFGKLYFTSPVKPADASKTYYIEDFAECLQKQFQKCREDSPFQSIDESMTKFKGRSSLKQYMPLKPVKRGIKLWMRSDAKSGYIYDFDIYQGKCDGDDPQFTTLGERVVTRLLRSVQCPPADVTVAIDRFFTSVRLIDSTPFPMVGTYMTNRKNAPKFSKRKMVRGDCYFQVNTNRTVASKWQDCKEVNVLSNCHGTETLLIKRKLKDGEKQEFECPATTVTYNDIMGGVDLSDQKMSVYELGRKSNKWWKKVFVRLLNSVVINSWIAYKEIHRAGKLQLKNFLVPLAESLCEKGIKQTKKKKKNVGRPSQVVRSVGEHWPTKINTRRRCAECSKQKKEVRVRTICTKCNIALCTTCFASYHKRI